MKKEFLTNFVELKKDELHQLCTIVNETLATESELPPVKEKKSTFGVADLWNLQRKMNTAGRLWNSMFRIIFFVAN
jgi:hypothetical protein